MRIADIRQRLTDQHRDLRERIGALVESTGTWPAGLSREAEMDFRVALGALSDALAHHNREEEQLLSSVVPQSGGADQRRMMDVHHAREHIAHLEVLRTVVDTRPLVAAMEPVRRSLHEVLAHMDREERELLHPAVLNDERYTSPVD